MKIKVKRLIAAVAICMPMLACAQKAYFVDGFHGGIWGHYPVGYTRYITGQLAHNLNWRVNLEIEPETWDREANADPEAFRQLQAWLNDSSSQARVEYVNPTYGQSYLFNISGESIIRHFYYGIKKLKTHFSDLSLNTYSSEEPCFTSALPQILNGFGIGYASLKNPNTCWGGYTRAHGGELVNWIGPDGSSVLASPRYEVEALKPASTWETIGNANSPQYIQAALAYGIKNPVGMCLQDAGWRLGPWLKGDYYQPTEYTLWTNYFTHIANKQAATDWRFSQEDVLTGLVWGAQVMQRLARQVRAAENKVMQAEKIAAINKLDKGGAYPAMALQEAWRGLLLSQHHDCWIVPYNGRQGDTWADKVTVWTNRTLAISDSIIGLKQPQKTAARWLKVYNTTGHNRQEWVQCPTPGNKAGNYFITDSKGNKMLMQSSGNDSTLLFKASVPALGYAFFYINNKTPGKDNPVTAAVTTMPNGNLLLQNDIYRIVLDKQHGGTIASLVAHFAADKDFVEQGSERRFNELRGNFYKKGGFFSSTQQPASFTVLNAGVNCIKVQVKGTIAGNPFTQTITLYSGNRNINIDLDIDWKADEGIGAFEETDYKATNLKKAFYDDRYKLLTLFPLALKGQKVYKNAPFDVTESKLNNTYYTSWDSIKNNVLLNWVDVTSADGQYGMAIYSDHTTSYNHGGGEPLALTTQYAGIGLWGRNYNLTQATQFSYTLVPHTGNWQQAQLEQTNTDINEPLLVVPVAKAPAWGRKSYLANLPEGWQVSSFNFEGDDLMLRLYNAGGVNTVGQVNIYHPIKNIQQVNLLNRPTTDANEEVTGGQNAVNLILKPFAFKTLRTTLR